MTRNAMIITDYHMHSTFSPDGNASVAEICRHAFDRGMTAIAITEHAEWISDYPETGFPRAAEFLAEIDRRRAEYSPRGMHVYSGVELGNPHHYPVQVARFLEAHPFEVVIASLHWLDGKNIHQEECFGQRDPYEVYADYFIELGHMARDFDFDILAHFDRIFWRGSLLGARFNPRFIEDVVREALHQIASHDRCLELNTKFLAEPYHWNDTLVTLFRWFREAGGRRVVINSDAHDLAEIGRNGAIGQQILRQAGFVAAAQFFQVAPRSEFELAG